MRAIGFAAVWVVACAVGYGQAAAGSTARMPYYVDPSALHAELLLRAPLSGDSEAGKAELAEEHRVERRRTPEEVAAAQFDDAHADIFLYGTVLGERFSASGLPLTAAFSGHLRNDAGVVNAPLKGVFKRPRPYHFDTTLHPVCGTDKDYSYPSGHATTGYLMGVVAARMVPEKAQAILERADGFAQNRVVCGAHYPSDLSASRAVAYAIFGEILGNPKFVKDLAAATEETRRKLGLGAVSAP